MSAEAARQFAESADRAGFRGSPPTVRGLLARVQHRHERTLRDVHRADPLHAVFALLLLLQQLPLPAHVAAVALGGHVLADGLDRLSADDLAADGGLQGDLEEVAVDLLLELLQEVPAAALGLAAVDDEAQGLDGVAVHEDVHLHQLADLEAGDPVVDGAVAGGDRLQLVEEVVDDLREGELVFEDLAVFAHEALAFVDAAAVLAELHDVADALGRRDHLGGDHRLADLLHPGHVREVGGVGDLDDLLLAVLVGGELDLVRDGGGGLDEGDVALPLQPLLDDVHVEHPQEAAAEARAQGFAGGGLVAEARPSLIFSRVIASRRSSNIVSPLG